MKVKISLFLSYLNTTSFDETSKTCKWLTSRTANILAYSFPPCSKPKESSCKDYTLKPQSSSHVTYTLFLEVSQVVRGESPDP